MTVWQDDVFNNTALIPAIAVNPDYIGAARKFIEKFMLKMYTSKLYYSLLQDTEGVTV